MIGKKSRREFLLVGARLSTVLHGSIMEFTRKLYHLALFPPGPFSLNFVTVCGGACKI